MQLDEASQLLGASKEQYEEILSIVQHHVDETVNWLSNMAAEFSWVGQAVSNSSRPDNIFRITAVRRRRMKTSERVNVPTGCCVAVIVPPAHAAH